MRKCIVCKNPAKPYKHKGNIHLSLFHCCQSVDCRSKLLKTPFRYMNETLLAKRLCQVLVANELPTKRKSYRNRLGLAFTNIPISGLTYASKKYSIVTFTAYNQEYYIGNNWAFVIDAYTQKVSVLKSPRESIEITKERTFKTAMNYYLQPFFKLWDTRYVITEKTIFTDKKSLVNPKYKLDSVIEIKNERYKILYLSHDNCLANLQNCRDGKLYYNYYLPSPATRKVYKTHIKK